MARILWFRRDLRLDDNTALHHALDGKDKVIALFIFDTNILEELPPDDARVTFIHQQVLKLHSQLCEKGSGLLIKIGNPKTVWQNLLKEYEINEVFFNRDYEPYAIKRDTEITEMLAEKKIHCYQFKDQVFFESHEVLKADGSPYTVYTPYKKRWLEKFNSRKPDNLKHPKWEWLQPLNSNIPELKEIGFVSSNVKVKDYNLSVVYDYAQKRDIPAEEGTSHLSVYLRFGTVSIRKIVKEVSNVSPEFLSELIWREFFMQILFHFPRLVNENFRKKYNGIRWRNNEEEFERWCNGETGYPIVDAGMRQLNETGYMHNRVRMITASFLCKHLLIDWQWGEAYFAKKLLDFELSSNNGNWQWAAGTGCDAAPYFRIFNPAEQVKKFDKDLKYVKRWVPEFGSSTYPVPIVDHKEARNRALECYKKGIRN